MSGGALELRTLVLRRVFHDGTTLTAPLAEPRHAVVGGPEAALAELQTFLESHLRDAPPHLLARYAFPDDTELVEVDVPLTPPGRDPLPVAVRTACVVVPHGRARWVVLPALDHTFHIDARDVLADAVADEAQRVVAAYGLSGRAFLDLLPPRAFELVPLEVSLRHQRGERAGELELARARETLDRIGDLVSPRDAWPLTGRDGPARTLDGLLSGDARLSALLVGPPGVGKTALLSDWVRRSDPRPLVFATSGARLVAGAHGYAEWQDRLQAVARAAARLDAVLYFPNLADLLNDGGGGTFDPAAALKPFLVERRVRLVGELDSEAAERLRDRHVGFFGCLNRIQIEPLSAAQTLVALRGRQEPDAPHLGEDGLEAVVALCERYLPYEAFPGKATRLAGEVLALHAHDRDSRGRPTPVNEAAVHAAFARRTGLPEVLLQHDRALRADTLTRALRRQLVGQDEAVRHVVDVLCMVKAGLQPADKPLATLLFVGPTGVGKTELARALATWLFGDAGRLARFDMSEYGDPYAAERLIRGTDRDEGVLTRRVRRQPFGVVLLDEIEKADAAVFDLLLQVAGEGRLTDARGQTAWFRNTLLVMTSNLGATHRSASIGLDPAKVDTAAHYRSIVEGHFRPEFTNRIDAVVPFGALDVGEVRAITELALGRLRARRGLVETGVRLTVTERATAALAIGGHHPAYGARALRRHLEDGLVAPLARAISATGAGREGAEVTVRLAEEAPTPADERHPAGELVLDVRGGRRAAQRRPITDASAIAGLRRVVAREMYRGLLSTARENLELTRHMLRADPGAGGLLRQQRELEDLWAESEAALASLQDAEELALHAMLEGEEVPELREEATRIYGDWTRVHVQLALANLPGRDGAWVLVQELDRSRALDVWLPNLLGCLRARGWTLDAHFEGVLRGVQDGWPGPRRWGPPRSLADVRAALSEPDRRFHALLLNVRGPYAGALLGLEDGVLCWKRRHGEAAHLYVRLVSLGGQPLPDDAWADEALAPLAPADCEARLKETFERYIDVREGQVYLDGDPIELAAREYWTRYETIAFEDLWGEDDVLDWYEPAYRPKADG